MDVMPWEPLVLAVSVWAALYGVYLTLRAVNNSFRRVVEWSGWTMDVAFYICFVLAASYTVCVFVKTIRTVQKKLSTHTSSSEELDPLSLTPHGNGSTAATPMGSVASSEGSFSDDSQDDVGFQRNLELPASLDDLKVRVTLVNSPGSFYVQLTQNDMLLKRLNEMLKQKYGSMEPQNVQWEADMHVAVLINGLWERGQICDTVASTNMAEVRRCDFGNRVSVHFSNLRPLQDSLVGSLALECALRDIRPAGGSSTWTATACDLMSEYVTGDVATMTIKEADLTEQQPVPVSLSCNKRGENVCIAAVLVSEGLAQERKQRWRKTYTLVKIDED